MSSNKDLLPPSRTRPESHQRGKSKLSRIPVKVESDQTPLRKPKWIRAKAPLGKEVSRIRRILRDKGLSSVCEEAACPNLGECFQHGTATFMIMGDICTRRCPFCDVAHGKPQPLDPQEPKHLADAIASMALKYVVITSVDRDDLRDGGGNHFAQCVAAIRQKMPKTSVELLVPDFRGRVEQALKPLMDFPPDVFNHNLETVPRLYRQARPGADYQGSLELLKRFKQQQPGVPTKSGLMLGLGERKEEILAVMQ
ncbi:MAG: lipoyl synthase, partial [Candidatus Thiodiazotropha weberae]|nr:lipoyl synthase [Candidatus Thiodiazotropha lotti]MCW4212318.1 lipoyl synthase [Candidatus Thiodiazotropha lotti]